MQDGRDWATEINTVVDHLTEYYVFPDVADRVVAVLRRRLADGAYLGIAEDRAFAAAVTGDLQSVNGDQHLRLRHSVEPVPADRDTGPWSRQRLGEDAALAGHGFARVERLAGNVGLLDIRHLYPVRDAGPAAVAAMNLIADTDALLIDLRGNTGGDPATIALLCGYLFDERTHLNDIYDRTTDRTTQYWSSPFVPGARFGGSKPVHVLIGPDTFSGAEEFAYDLRQLGRATLVGEVTRGGAHPGGRYRVGEHLFATVPSGRAVNPVSGTNWEGVGVRPDLAVDAARALDVAYRLALEHVRTLGSAGARRSVADEARRALAKF